MLPSLLSVAISLGFRHDSFWANVYFKGDFSCSFDNTAWIKLLHSIRNSNILSRWQFLLWKCNTRWEVLLSKQVNYNQVVMKCQILQECFLQNFKCKNFQNMEHQIQGLFKDLLCFQGLSRALIFFPQIQGLSRTSQGPYEPDICFSRNCSSWHCEHATWSSSAAVHKNIDHETQPSLVNTHMQSVVITGWCIFGIQRIV